jgi:Tfp pilus assembly pilus retraction ATPase PilT
VAGLISIADIPNGIVLVTGPTGCGKSTALYTFLSSLNTKERRIVTVEDPVEYKLSGVIQIAVKPEINLTFANGLRSILRGDPNVIMVGEMRDKETSEIAIRGRATQGKLRLDPISITEPERIASPIRRKPAYRNPMLEAQLSRTSRGRLVAARAQAEPAPPTDKSTLRD